MLRLVVQRMNKNFKPAVFVIFLYSSIFEILRRILPLLLKRVAQKKGWDITERQKIPSAVRDHRNRTVVWVHAASLGESKLLFKFLEILEQRHPEDLYLITATTRAGVHYLEKNRPSSVCGVGYLPFDTIPLMKSVIQQYGVSRIWLLETELWPSMLLVSIHEHIPVGLVNARIEEKSFNRYKKFQGILNFLFGFFDIVLAQNETYAERFSELGVKKENIHIVGNIKSHVFIKRPPRKDWLALRRALNLNDNNFVLTAGCIHAGEGPFLKQCFSILEKNHFPCKMIVVPRHLEDVTDLLEELGGNVVHLNDITTSRKWDICVIEKMGILDDMYKIADAALVGGTFVNVGGHSVWDAARFGIPVFFGPDYHTQTDSCEKLLNAGVGFKADDSSELAKLILKVMKTDAKKFMNAQNLFMETVNKRQSVLEPLIP